MHREWFCCAALAELLGADEKLSDPHLLYGCDGRLLTHKKALFRHLMGRWRDLFNVTLKVLVYDLMSSYWSEQSSVHISRSSEMFCSWYRHTCDTLGCVTPVMRAINSLSLTARRVFAATQLRVGSYTAAGAGIPVLVLRNPRLPQRTYLTLTCAASLKSGQSSTYTLAYRVNAISVIDQFREPRWPVTLAPRLLGLVGRHCGGAGGGG